MKTFLGYYVDQRGKRCRLVEKADNRVQCCERLATRGIVPVMLWGVPWSGGISGMKPTPRELALFFSQLAMALNSGVPLLEALAPMQREQHNVRMSNLLSCLQEYILAGTAFSEALRRQDGIPSMVCEWMAIGERQGRLAQTLEEIAAHLENREKMKKQLQQQLLYPLMVLVAVVLVGLFLSLVVMPMMARQFIGINAQGSGALRLFLVGHDFLRTYGGMVAVILLVGGFLLYRQQTHRYGNQSLQMVGRQLVLGLPLLKKYFVLRVYVPFARFLGQMLHAGIPVDEAMCAVQAYFEQSMFAKDVAAIGQIIAKGGSLSLAISDSVFVPVLAKQMLQNGERYGHVSEALLQSATYYESTLLEELQLILRFIEPLAVAMLGMLVLFMALSLFIPVMDAYQMIVS